MKKYAMLCRYTPEAWAAIVERGLDRTEAIKLSLRQLGGQLDAAYWMMAHYDALVIFEVPDEITAMGISARIQASGTFAHMEIHQLFEAKDHKAIIESARGHEFHHHAHEASPVHR